MLIVGGVIGWQGNIIYNRDKELTCSDFATKHAMWKGFLSMRDGDMRCFWLEDKYPWRIRQGVPVK
jgi:hypothetical protein